MGGVGSWGGEGGEWEGMDHGEVGVGSGWMHGAGGG